MRPATPSINPAPPAGPADALPRWTDRGRYAALRTFRRDGSGVDTPVWFAVDLDGTVLFRTPTDSAKLRRLTREPSVELLPCTWRGRLRAGETIRATAEVLPRSEAVAAEVALRRRYGWKWNVVPLLPVPGVAQAHADRGIGERIGMARASVLWEGSSIVRLRPAT